MRNRPLKKQKVIHILAYEGDTEEKVLEHLKVKLEGSRAFRFENLKGLGDLKVFIRKYDKLVKKYSLKPKKSISQTFRFIFVFDNDLPDSKQIRDFILNKGHLTVQPDPNIEGMYLKIIEQYKAESLTASLEVLRDLCKKRFEKVYGCEAHELSVKDLKQLLGEDSEQIRSKAQNNKSLLELVSIFL
jgi:hypothetical protein